MASVSGVLTNKIAIEININIVKAFALLFQRMDMMEQKQLQTDQKLEVIFDPVSPFMETRF